MYTYFRHGRYSVHSDADKHAHYFVVYCAADRRRDSVGLAFFQTVNSEDWPAIQGKCTFAGVTKKEGVYELKVLYSYKLATEKFYICGEFYKDFFNEAQANQWAQALQEMDIPIHCHPSTPEKSILWVEDLESIVKTRQVEMQGEAVSPTSIAPR